MSSYIEVRNVSKSFSGRAILQNISLSVEQGTTVGLDVYKRQDFMKEKSYFKGVPPNLPPKGSRCDGCPYWRGIGCVFCYREQLKPKTGDKHEP